MASITPSLSSLLFLTLAFILTSISPAFSQTGLKITLNSVDSGGSYTTTERFSRGAKRSSLRLQNIKEMVLASKSKHPKNLSTTVYAGLGEYLMNYSIGTPPISFSSIMDTGSDLVWTQCQPCLECFPQPLPFYDPKKSSSYANESCTSKFCKDLLPFSDCNPFYGCVYIYGYGSGITSGFLGSETFTFEKVSVPNIAFGCGLVNLIEASIIGLGRGHLSLVSQLGEPEFSYCLTSYGENKPSTLLIGSQPKVNSTSGSKNTTTPLLRNKWAPSFYYMSLEGITVGNNTLPINKTTFAILPDGNGGVIIDSGTTLTYLELNAYLLVQNAFIAQVKLPVDEIAAFELGFDLCFKLPKNGSSVFIPKLVFHFTDLDLDFPTENYMVGNSSIFVQGLGVMCLAIGASLGFSIFGNIQQQNYAVTYNLVKETLSFSPTECDKF